MNENSDLNDETNIGGHYAYEDTIENRKKQKYKDEKM